MSGYDDDYKKTWNNMDLLMGIRDAYGYKNFGSDEARCFIMKIPITSLQYIEGKSKPILYKTDNVAEQGGGAAIVLGKFQTVLLPEYILGSIEYKNGKIVEFVDNPNYSGVHDYKNDGLVCTDQLLEDYIEKNKMSYNDKSFEKADKIISEENTKYMEKTFKNSRTENSIKEYSKKDMLLSKFNEMANKIKNFFSKDKVKEGEKSDVDREQ